MSSIFFEIGRDPGLDARSVSDFDVVGSAERIGGPRRAALVGDDLLGAEGDQHRFLGRQGQGLVARVGVERLRPAEHGGQGLERRPGRRCSRAAGRRASRRSSGCGSGASRSRDPARPNRSRGEPGPDAARGPELGDLLEEVVVGGEEEREPRGEGVDVEPGRGERPRRRRSRRRR